MERPLSATRIGWLHCRRVDRDKPAGVGLPGIWRIVSTPTAPSNGSVSVDATDGSPAGSAAPALTRDDVDHLAHLARLDVTDAELDLYLGQLSVILESVARVTAVASGDIEGTTHAVPLTNVYRPDVPVPCLTQQEALAGAPSAQDGRFRVPQILGEEQ
jgi:aspartyl-tRNA(Asn)/glutamyl-tRNA(Gln) amidotransferase subunit C